MKDYLGLIRWGNLLIIGFTQLFFIYLTRVSFLEFSDIALIISTLLTAAAGYVINDFYDLEADKINKPNNVYIGKIIPKDHSRRFYFLLVTLSLWIGYYALAELTSVILTINISLFIYSYRLKRWPLIGNIVVSICTASVIFIVYISNPPSVDYYKSDSFNLLIFFSLCAFIISMVRELVKDIEDIDGDKVAGYKTLPIVAGIKPPKSIAMLSLFVLLILYFRAALGNISHDAIDTYYPVIGFIIVTGVSIILLFKIGLANKKEDYSKLSTYCKIFMLVGMLTALLF
jgi:4-hydroxybenzoate polyprenyltransferase